MTAPTPRATPGPAVAVIPARGGSKGVPGKNLRPVGGRPLVVWSIEHALACASIDRVLVSTDSPEIAEVARAAGAEVPGLRPEHLARDDTPTEPVLLHVLDGLAAEGCEPRVLVLLQPTSPVRRAGRGDEAVALVDSGRFDSVVGVVGVAPFFWRAGDPPEPLYDPDRRPRRQDLEADQVLHREVGSIYATSTPLLRSSGNRLTGRIGLLALDEDEGIDVDTEVDLAVVDALLRHRSGAS